MCGSAEPCHAGRGRAAEAPGPGTLAVVDKGTDFVLEDGKPAADIQDMHRIVGVWQRGPRVSGSVEEFTHCAGRSALDKCIEALSFVGDSRADAHRYSRT